MESSFGEDRIEAIIVDKSDRSLGNLQDDPHCIVVRYPGLKLVLATKLRKGGSGRTTRKTYHKVSATNRTGE